MCNGRKPGVSRRTPFETTAGPARSAAAGPVSTLIDIGRCDGGPDRGTPVCIEACMIENTGQAPRPVNPIPALFPRDRTGYFSGRRHPPNRPTPCSLPFIHTARVEHEGRRRAAWRAPGKTRRPETRLRAGMSGYRRGRV